MDYCIEETLYGPEIRFNDWEAVSGRIERAGGSIILSDPAGTTARCVVYPYGGGGDVELSVSVAVGTKDAASILRIHVHAQPNRPEVRGFVIELSGTEWRLIYKDAVVGRVNQEASGTHAISLATLGETYEARLDGRLLGRGRMEPPYVDNEGWLEISSSGGIAEVVAVAERAIAPRHFPAANGLSTVGVAPGWRKSELLYEEAFNPEDFERLWMCNVEGEAARPTLTPAGYTFRKMSNALLKRRFTGPIAVDYLARPVPSPDHSSGVTDAIFIWMADLNADAEDESLQAFLARQTEAGDASLKMLLPLSFYWVDFGGTNNVTTRLRKNPFRHLMRQYTDRARLLRPDHTYRITALQHDHAVEFWVDGDPMIRVWDPTPLRHGHVGVRAFCSDLELLGLSIWRIEDA